MSHIKAAIIKFVCSIFFFSTFIVLRQSKATAGIFHMSRSADESSFVHNTSILKQKCIWKLETFEQTTDKMETNVGNQFSVLFFFFFWYFASKQGNLLLSPLSSVAVNILHISINIWKKLMGFCSHFGIHVSAKVLATSKRAGKTVLHFK